MRHALHTTSRRELLVTGAGLAAASLLAGGSTLATLSGQVDAKPVAPGSAVIRSKDGTSIFVKSWGLGPPVVFSHGWPLSADAWDGQMNALADAGYRVIAHDRRSHGRSDQVWSGNDLDQYADDLADVLDALEVRDATLVGHSTGGGEVARYIGRHGVSRVAKTVLISAIAPVMPRSGPGPVATLAGAFGVPHEGLIANRAEYYHQLATPYFGYNRAGGTASSGMRDEFWRQGMMGGAQGQYDSIRRFSEADFAEDLRRMTVPTLVIHGDDDQIAPCRARPPLRAV